MTAFLQPIIEFIIKNAKNIAIFTLLAGIVYGGGIAINKLLPWDYLIDFFSLIKKGLSYIDFMIDTNALINTIFIAMTAKIIYISIYGTIKIVKYFE